MYNLGRVQPKRMGPIFDPKKLKIEDYRVIFLPENNVHLARAPVSF